MSIRFLPTSPAMWRAGTQSCIRGASLLLGCLALAGTGQAQTCAAPTNFPSPDPPESIPVLDVNTCLGDPPVILCGGAYLSSGPAATVRFHYDPTCMQHLGRLQVQSYTSAMHPVMFLSDQPGDCDGKAGSCVDSGDNVSPISFDGRAAGEYQIIVASPDSDPPDTCGWVRLAFEGYIDTTGVCSGEDIIFRGDFDAPVIGRPAAPAAPSLVDALERATR